MVHGLRLAGLTIIMETTEKINVENLTFSIMKFISKCEKDTNTIK